MSRRDKRAIDYSVFHKTGKKVFKDQRDLDKVERGFQRLAEMAANELKDQEAKLVFSMEQFVVSNELDLFFDSSEIQEAILECKDLIGKYGAVHVDLKRELGELYDHSFSNVPDKLLPLNTWIRDARVLMKRMKAEAADSASKRSIEAGVSNDLKEQNLLRSKFKHLEARILKELNNINSINSE